MSAALSTTRGNRYAWKCDDGSTWAGNGKYCETQTEDYPSLTLALEQPGAVDLVTGLAASHIPVYSRAYVGDNEVSLEHLARERTTVISRTQYWPKL